MAGSSTDSERELTQFVSTRLSGLADADKAPIMQAYMKTDMPFYGVQKPDREPIVREMVKRFRAESRTALERSVLAVWNLPHREEKYAAIQLAVRQPDLISSKSLPLYRRLIRGGAWWDFVDDVAIRLVGTALLRERSVVRPALDKWLDGPDLWLRRSVVISQIKHKGDTDHHQLFADCLDRAHEKEFFIQKAIGWALREYSKTAPERVRVFLLSNQERLAALSFREGSKGLVRSGHM